MDFIKVATPQVGDEEVEAVREVLLSGNFVSGKKVQEFEAQFAEYVGTKHAVAVNSGTSALYIALESMGVQKGDEVIVPPVSFFATISAVLYLGGIPVFADIDLDDLCLSPDNVESVVTEATKAIIPVHLYGAPAKIDQLCELSEKHKLQILEDCAQAHGTELNGQKAGSFGTAGAFSFFATKHMTTGEGGIITTNDEAIAGIARKLRNHGMSGRDDHELLGYNNRMTELEAAIGIVQLKRLDELNAKRIKNSEYLINHLGQLDWLRFPVGKGDIRHTYFWCPLMIDEEKSDKTIGQLKEHLSNNKIGFRARYSSPLYKQKALVQAGIDYSDLYLANAEKISGKLIGLPNHPGLDQSDLDRIIRVVHSF